MDTVTMSQKELQRINTLEQIKTKQLTILNGAVILDLSTRQVKRLMKKYRIGGVASLAHQNRGRVSNRRLDPNTVTQTINLCTTKYKGFNPVHALDHLTTEDGISMGIDTLRKIMIANTTYQPQRRKYRKGKHSLRPRMAHAGELVQLDGSPHDWFEGRVNPKTGQTEGILDILAAIDDANGQVKFKMVKHESTLGYFSLVKDYFTTYGKPVAFYSDRHGVFTVNEHDRVLFETKKPKSVEEECEFHETQFGRSMKTLGIKSILAYSPQAKGRVERLMQTLQDRLVSEFRLRNISSMEEANKFLPEFEVMFNRWFGVEASSPINFHRSLTTQENQQLDQILSIQETRTLSNNLTCQFNNQIIQIIPEKSGYYLKHAKIIIHQTMDHKILTTYQNRLLHHQTHLKTLHASATVKQLTQKAKQSSMTFTECLTEASYNGYDTAYQLAPNY